MYPATSLNKNCIEFDFQADPNYYVDLRQTYLYLKLKFVKFRGYGTNNSKQQSKREHKGEAEVDEETGMGQGV